MTAARWRVAPALLALGLCLGCGSRDPDVLLEQGIRSCEAGRYRAAARTLAKAAQLEPRHAAARLWCGVAYWKAGSGARALPHFMAAAELDPANPLPLEYAALIHARQGEWPEAAKRLNAAYRRMPDSPRILVATAVHAARASASASAPAPAARRTSSARARSSTVGRVRVATSSASLRSKASTTSGGPATAASPPRPRTAPKR